MAIGDYDWAVGEIAAEVGDQFYSDSIGLNTLHMALYERDSLSPDLQHAAYNAFFGYDDPATGEHFTGYMEEQYEWDAEDNFDWDDYREWYDSQ